jgi:hypothetical protein
LVEQPRGQLFERMQRGLVQQGLVQQGLVQQRLVQQRLVQQRRPVQAPEQVAVRWMLAV